MVVQTHACGTCQECSVLSSPTYNIHHGVLCLLRVYALYARSCRILGFLAFLGTGSFITALVGLFPPTLPQHLLLSIKATLVSSRKLGGETIPVISSFVGCAQYTPHIGYVPDPACDFSSMIRLIILVLAVDVSQGYNYLVP